jgi:hypothetical protein
LGSSRSTGVEITFTSAEACAAVTPGFSLATTLRLREFRDRWRSLSESGVQTSVGSKRNRKPGGMTPAMV